MPYCDCACARGLENLRDQLLTLEHQVNTLRYDLEHETNERRDAIRQVSNDITDGWNPAS